MTPLKENNKTPIMDPKNLKLNEMTDKEFRIFFLEKISEL
jgi:hypothetical protein